MQEKLASTPPPKMRLGPGLFSLGVLLSTAAGVSRASMTSSPFSLSPFSSMTSPAPAKPPVSLLVGIGCRSNKSKKLQLPSAKCDCGEDAFFLKKLKSAITLGVSDGVGGYGSLGCNPAELSWELMNYCGEEAGKMEEEGEEIFPVKVLKRAYHRVLKEKKIKMGGATACVISLGYGDHVVKTANLGDSGCYIFRNKKLVFKTKDLTHGFNTPYQLSIPVENKSLRLISDDPLSSEIQEKSVLPGDLLVLATDGLFDNMGPEQIFKTVQEELVEVEKAVALTDYEKAEKLLTNASKNLVARAAYLAENPEKSGSAYSRFEGKPDDTTILLALVVPELKPIMSHL